MKENSINCKTTNTKIISKIWAINTIKCSFKKGRKAGKRTSGSNGVSRLL